MEHRTSADSEDFAAEMPLYGDEDDFPSEAPARPQFADHTIFHTTPPGERTHALTNPSATNTLFREDVAPVAHDEHRWRLADRPTYGLMAAGIALAGLVGFMVASYSQRGAAPAVGSAPPPAITSQPVAAPAPPAAAAADAKQVSPVPEIPAASAKPSRSAGPIRSAELSPQGLNGWWSVTNRIESTGPQAQDLNLGYRLLLTQNGSRITGTGRKWMENGRQLPASEQTAVTVDGMVDGPRVELHLSTRDTSGANTGTFTYNLTNTGVLQGRFSSDATRSSGSSQARRMPSPE